MTLSHSLMLLRLGDIFRSYESEPNSPLPDKSRLRNFGSWKMQSLISIGSANVTNASVKGEILYLQVLAEAAPEKTISCKLTAWQKLERSYDSYRLLNIRLAV